MRFSEYDQYDGLGLAELVRNKDIAAAELVEEAIARIEAVNPKLNAVICKLYDQARRQVAAMTGEEIFAGVPFLVKDLMADVAGVPTRKGCRFLRNYTPDHDNEIVARYRKAGVMIVGKTNAPEFGQIPVTEPELFGPTYNPWDTARTPGGSSGGSAAAVAAGIVPMAHGNDGGGSIRIPASCCGLFGLKPSRGRMPFGPDASDPWQGLASDHVITRSVRDSAAMLDATAGPDIGAPYLLPNPAMTFLEAAGTPPKKLKIAFTAHSLLQTDVDPECIRGVTAAADLLRDLGHEVEEAAPEINGDAFMEDFITMVCGETAADIAEAEKITGRRAAWRDFEPGTWATCLMGRQFSAADFSAAVRRLKLTGRVVGRFFENYDIFMTPTLGKPPLHIGELQPVGIEGMAMKLLGRLNAGRIMHLMRNIDESAEKIFTFIPFTPVFNATGHPAMSLPLHWTGSGLPVGIQFVGRFADETTLFQLAGQLEKARPWFDKRPPVKASALA
jgi:amidase